APRNDLRRAPANGALARRASRCRLGTAGPSSGVRRRLDRVSGPAHRRARRRACRADLGGPRRLIVAPSHPAENPMANARTRTGLQLRSTVNKDGVLELSLISVVTPEPKPDEVIVRVDASPINPSDQGLLFAGADMSTATLSGPADNPVVTARLSPA